MCIIKLRAHLEDDLLWEEARAEASRAAEQGKKIFWEFDFGKLDPTHFSPLLLAVDHFSQTLARPFLEATQGAVLYRGKPPQWIVESALESASLFADVMHRLAAFLPDEIPGFCLLDVTDFSSQAQVAQLFSEARFAYVHLALKGAKWGKYLWDEEDQIRPQPACSAQTGICLPHDELWSEELCAELDQLLASQTQPYRLLPEALIAEKWDGLDHLIALEKGLSTQGKRMLRGFEASGGSIHLYRT